MRLPVAVPDIFVGDQAPSSSVDRGHALSSLYPPPAALASLPNSIISAYVYILPREDGIVNEREGRILFLLLKMSAQG